MKKQIMGLFFVTTMMLFSLNAYATTVTWDPTDTTTLTLSLDFLGSSDVTGIALFDDDLTLTDPVLSLPTDATVITFALDTNNDYLVTASSGTSGTLTDTDQFILGVTMDGVNWVTAVLTLEEKSANLWFVTFEGIDGTVLVNNVTPVPVPAALWLFGSAMVGLVVVGRRKISAEESVV